jgi:hypothetical protein
MRAKKQRGRCRDVESPAVHTIYYSTNTQTDKNKKLNSKHTYRLLSKLVARLLASLAIWIRHLSKIKLALLVARQKLLKNMHAVHEKNCKIP